MKPDARAIDKCEQEIDAANANGVNDQAEYDKQLLTLSAAFLALSLAFVKDVVTLSSALHLWALFLSWILVSFCIMLVLFSYQFSIYVNSVKVKEYWEAELNRLESGVPGEASSFPYAFAEVVKCLNRLTGTFFAIGVVLFFYFVMVNVCHTRIATVTQQVPTEKQQTLSAQPQKTRVLNK